jgi:hypothetical protein
MDGAHMGRPCLDGKQKDANFKRADGKIANIAYSRDKIRKGQAKK